jgi:hypothetical protein
MGDLSKEIAVEIKLLDTSVFPVGFKDDSLVGDLDRVWKVEGSGDCSKLTPPVSVSCLPLCIRERERSRSHR